MLAIGRCSSVARSIGGERTGSISVVAQMSGVRLLYTVTDREGANEGDELVDTRLYVDALRRLRQWFLVPQVSPPLLTGKALNHNRKIPKSNAARS